MAASNSKTRALVLKCKSSLSTLLFFQDKICYERFIPKAFVIQAQGNTGYSFVVFNHQIEAIFVIHYSSQAHNTNMDVVFGFAHLEEMRSFNVLFANPISSYFTLSFATCFDARFNRGELISLSSLSTGFS